MGQRQPPLFDLNQIKTKENRAGILAYADGSQTPLERLILQLEYDAESPLFLALGRRELRHYAMALTKCWRLLGSNSGDRIAIFDFGSSPITYLASSLYTPYLSKGAADWLGCVPICNDGASQLSGRAVDIVRFVRPRLMFIRADCFQPFVQEVNRQGLQLRDYIEALVVAENEGMMPREVHRNYEGTLGVPIFRLLRADVILFLGVECPSCRLLHTWDSHYLIEVLDEERLKPVKMGERGLLAITNCFLAKPSTFRYLSMIRGALASRDCSWGKGDLRIQIW